MTQVLKEKMTHVKKYRKESDPGFSNMYTFYDYNIEYKNRQANLKKSNYLFGLPDSAWMSE